MKNLHEDAAIAEMIMNQPIVLSAGFQTRLYGKDRLTEGLYVGASSKDVTAKMSKDDLQALRRLQAEMDRKPLTEKPKYLKKIQDLKARYEGANQNRTFKKRMQEAKEITAAEFLELNDTMKAVELISMGMKNVVFQRRVIDAANHLKANGNRMGSAKYREVFTILSKLFGDKQIDDLISKMAQDYNKSIGYDPIDMKFKLSAFVDMDSSKSMPIIQERLPKNSVRNAFEGIAILRGIKAGRETRMDDKYKVALDKLFGKGATDKYLLSLNYQKEEKEIPMEESACRFESIANRYKSLNEAEGDEDPKGSRVPFKVIQKDLGYVTDFIGKKFNPNPYIDGALYPEKASKAMPKYPLSKFEIDFAKSMKLMMLVPKNQLPAYQQDYSLSQKQADILTKIAEKISKYFGDLNKAINIGNGMNESVVMEGGPGSGGLEIKTRKIKMPMSPFISVGTRKGIIQNMPFADEDVELSMITHVAQKSFRPDKVKNLQKKKDVLANKPISLLKIPSENVYHVMDGHHRFLAAQKAGMTSLPARVWVRFEPPVPVDPNVAQTAGDTEAEPIAQESDTPLAEPLQPTVAAAPTDTMTPSDDGMTPPVVPSQAAPAPALAVPLEDEAPDAVIPEEPKPQEQVVHTIPPVEQVATQAEVPAAETPEEEKTEEDDSEEKTEEEDPEEKKDEAPKVESKGFLGLLEAMSRGDIDRAYKLASKKKVS